MPPELMLSDAINQDVSGELIEAPKSARELAMEKIANDNIARVSGDFDGKIDPDIDPDNPDSDQLALQNPTPEPAKPAPKVHTVKIDGEERTVTDDELIRTYQKNAAADRRLEEATNLLRQAQEQAAQLATPAQPAPNPVSEAPAELKTQVKNVIETLFGGDEESASQALTDLLVNTSRGGDQPTPAAPNIDIDQLTVQIQERMEIGKAFVTLQNDYPDLIADPDLEMLTAMKIDRAVAAGTPRSVAMISAAQEVYKSIGKTPGRQQEPTKPSTTTRLENKQRLDTVKPASGVASRTSAPVEEDPSSVIAEMAQRRLGQSMPRRET